MKVLPGKRILRLCGRALCSVSSESDYTNQSSGDDAHKASQALASSRICATSDAGRVMRTPPQAIDPADECRWRRPRPWP